MTRRKQDKRFLRRKHKYLLAILALAIILSAIGITRFVDYSHRHFRDGTIINDVDCSKLTVEEANTKINEKLHNPDITYIFVDDEFTIQEQQLFGIKLEDNAELKEILQNQNDGVKELNYTLQHSIFVNDVKVKDYLRTFSCFKEENIKKSQNAYLALDSDNMLYIEPEFYGNELDFNEAYELALSTLRSGSTVIDFRPITKQPEILSTDPGLILQRDKLNSILASSVKYILPDDSTFCLDANTIKNWLYKNDDGIYQLDLDSSLEAFIDELEKKVTEASSTVVFKASGIGDISLPLDESKRATIDREGELAKLKEELDTSLLYIREPIYSSKAFSLENQTSYVEVDTTRQNVWMFVNGNCIVDTLCVTGNYPNHHTPSGIFFPTYKVKDTYLKGTNDDGSKYSCHVDYWVPFNGNIGFHDASWRTKFGGTIYKGNGSHGCVNLPKQVAPTFYENLDLTMPIIVYRS